MLKDIFEAMFEAGVIMKLDEDVETVVVSQQGVC
jgi:hypothetical protein